MDKKGVPTQDITSLSTPKALAGALESLHDIFSRCLPDVSVVMGGGSVLAARWHHRISTDIDLFVSPAAMLTLTTKNSLLYQAVLNLLQGVGEANIEAFSGFLSGEIKETPFSLAASEFIREDRAAFEKIATTDFQAATNEEILEGKIMGRLHRRGNQPVQAPIRDLYDIAVAARLAPGVVNRVLGGITTKGRSVIARDLRFLPGNLHEVDPKPLLKPRYQVEREGLAGAVATAVEAGDESLLPPVFLIAQTSELAPQP